MDVYQCPECELKFRLATELQQHLTLEHPDFHIGSKNVEDALSASHRHRRRGYRPDSGKNAG